ncbi:MAG: hypothetical protein U0Z53_26785 [Blastocatellia bacterium]
MTEAIARASARRSDRFVRAPVFRNAAWSLDISSSSELKSDLPGLFEDAPCGKVARRIRQATTASILLPVLFPFAQSLSGKARLLRRREKPPAQKASFHSGNALTADDEGRALSLNGQALRPKASFLPDQPPFLTGSELALWAGGALRQVSSRSGFVPGS